jgi:PAS domain S-box-containing protein
MSSNDIGVEKLLQELTQLRASYNSANEQIKSLEEELKNSQSRYNSILRSFPDVLTITDLEGKILFSSPKAYEMFGYGQSHEFINRSIIEYIDPRDHEKAIQGIRDMFASDFKGATEYRGKKSDGTSFNIEVNGQFILNEKGEPENMIFLTRDITKRIETEDLLERTEERFRRLVENINDVIYEIDTTGIVKYVSPSIERILGYTQEELTGKNFFAFMHPEDRSRLMLALANLGKKDYSFLEYRYIAKDGSLKWVRSSTKAIIRDNVIVGGIGSLTDLTERKMYEERLMKLTLAVDQSPVMIVITDLKSNIEYVNPAFTAITGYSSDEVIGQPTRILQSGKTDPAVYKDLWNSILNGLEWHGEWINKRKDAERAWRTDQLPRDQAGYQRPQKNRAGADQSE